MTNEYALKIVENFIELMERMLDSPYSNFEDVENFRDFKANWSIEYTPHENNPTSLGPFEICFFPNYIKEELEEYERDLEAGRCDRIIEIDDNVSREVLEDIKTQLYNLN